MGRVRLSGDEAQGEGDKRGRPIKSEYLCVNQSGTLRNIQATPSPHHTRSDASRKLATIERWLMLLMGIALHVGFVIGIH